MTESSAGSGVYTETGPFAIVPEWVLDAEISDRAVRLYALLARYADRSGKSWPSRKALAERLRCSRDTLDRAIRELIAVDALTVEARRDEQGDRATNLYLLRQVRPGGGMGAATPLGRGAVTGGGMDAVGNENQGEREPEERERDGERALAVPAYDPRKGTRIDGRNLPFDALVEVTQADERAEGGRIARALKQIRGMIVDDTPPEFLADDQGEQLIAGEIRRRAAMYADRWPTVELTPTALAANWSRVATSQPGRSSQDAYAIAQDAIDSQRSAP